MICTIFGKQNNKQGNTFLGEVISWGEVQKAEQLANQESFFWAVYKSWVLLNIPFIIYTS